MFTTTVDFGAGVFNGSPGWLQLAVRSNGTAEAFTTLRIASVAAGYQSTSSGDNSIAMGFQAKVSHLGAAALGSQAQATNINSIAIDAALSQGQGAVALGEGVAAYGFGSVAIGNYVSTHDHLATALGNRARARHAGSFVWADASQIFTDFESALTNQFSIRAAGGVRLDNDTRLNFGNQTRQMINLWNAEYGIGVQGDAQYFRTGNDFHWYRGGSHSDVNGDGGGLTVNGTFVSTSDRNAKENFQTINAQAVLDKVVALPLSEWNYKADTSSRHIGPMAQDFKAAFYLGADDKHIATVAADGVALAAIQGLNQKLESENAALKATIETLERMVESLANRWARTGQHRNRLVDHPE